MEVIREIVMERAFRRKLTLGAAPHKRKWRMALRRVHQEAEGRAFPGHSGEGDILPHPGRACARPDASSVREDCLFRRARRERLSSSERFTIARARFYV